MPRTTSKRSRKQRDRNSLRHKKTAVDDALQEALLAPELLPDSAYRAGEQEGGEALVLLPRKKGGNGKKVEDAEAVPMSKAERRKLQQVAMKQKRRDVTIQALAKLEQHQLPDEQLELLRPTHARGAAETKRQRLKRALRLQRAGLQAEAGDELVRQRRAQRGGGSEGGLCSEASDEGDGDSEGGGAPRRSSAQAASRPAPQPYRSGAAVSEEARQQQQQQLTQQMRSAKAAAEAAKKELSLPASSKGDADGAAVGPAPPPRQEAIMPHRIRHVHRPEEVEAARLQLPIAGMEQEIVEAVGQHDVLVLSGATGCGKTTQVPQFLYEAGFGCREFPEKAGMVGVTQPRRVAAVSTAQRVAHELDSAIGDAVGYQVRYDRAVGEGTALKFMTDGILMRELQQDFLLSQYSVLVVDEAHERSLNTDLLLGMLSRLVPLRRKKAEASSHLPLDSPQRTWPLKLIIMSATLRTDDFLGNERLFPNQPPLIEVPARQYPVTVHFARHTELRNYEAACFRKVSRIHKELPPGGILVFLTGQREVESLCARLRRAFCRSAADRTEEAPAAARAGEEDDEAGVDGVGMYGADSAEALGAELESSAEEEEGTPDLMTDEEEEEEEEEVVVEGGEDMTPEEVAAAEARYLDQQGKAQADGAAAAMHVLPLYAMLPAAQQQRVFQKPPDGARLVVVATNVAETSLTIPGIRYVVDAGRSKQRLLESSSGLARFEVRWISKASAAQRAGRAGRTGPGHAYRLYSSAHFTDTFPDHAAPEIRNTALEGVVLQMRALGIDKVERFPFPTPPEPGALQSAAACLHALGALDGPSGALTDLGRAMAAFPISPRHARMLLEAALLTQRAQDAHATGLAADRSRRKRATAPAMALAYGVALAACLSVDSPFVHIDSVGAGDTGWKRRKATQQSEGPGEDPGEPDGEDAEEEEEEEGCAVGKKRKNASRAAAQERSREKDRARGRHARFRDHQSEALSALRALCAYEVADSREAWCADNFMHSRNLQEASALWRQLARLLLRHGGAALEALRRMRVEARLGADMLTAPLPEPPPAMLDRLRRAVAAGWCDQVARRVRSAEYLQQQQQDGGGGRRAVRYQAAMLAAETVFLHPRSPLHHAPPQFVVYGELLRTVKRPYMARLTAIEPHWLPESAPCLCSVSEPVATTPPKYSKKLDAVLSCHRVEFGPHAWLLPPHWQRHPTLQTRAAVFAAALLDGTVFTPFAVLRPLLAAPPSSAARPESRGSRRVAELTDALARSSVDCKAALAVRWRQDPGFLRPEIGLWLKRGCDKVLRRWPDLVSKALQEVPAPPSASV